MGATILDLGQGHELRSGKYNLELELGSSEPGDHDHWVGDVRVFCPDLSEDADDELEVEAVARTTEDAVERIVCSCGRLFTVDRLDR